jgi:ABC1 atypical kinase-like domain
MVNFKFVNHLEENLKAKILKAIAENEEGSNKLSENYHELGGGACGTVYAVSEHVVLKWNNGWMAGDTRDHLVLEALQGLPLVPTLYGYSDDGRYILIERIHGITVSQYEFNKMFTLLNYNMEQHKELVQQFYDGSLERGWLPNDLHGGNAMITPEGKFYVVDFGLFKVANKATVWDYTNSEGEVKELTDWGEVFVNFTKEQRSRYELSKSLINNHFSLDLAV